jgi:hypothetical protein
VPARDIVPWIRMTAIHGEVQRAPHRSSSLIDADQDHEMLARLAFHVTARGSLAHRQPVDREGEQPEMIVGGP